MKRLLLTLLSILTLYGSTLAYASSEKVTGEQALASSANAKLTSITGYNASSPYATLPRENAVAGERYSWGGMFKLSRGGCNKTNVHTGGCSCPSGFSTKRIDLYNSDDLYFCEKRNY
ncbi:hypothetical protein VITU102760_24820 [Vibrio tubiashii]|uniref:Uncharacterized protein n=1 Tax=Vibrio tubiashii ATCC 19109 TaxID=1051646 RepID=F9T6S8_9VIBR|nr:hypothetical protein [Vibrio tubiashii]AIW17492.1 hypothetical protein IX91_25890 [Vibrio tubiashii ATCC 19109]EGU54483.1 hypothetical protein VITU9109_02877 [Vibrio tubiashii ATCC 19109]EIF05994.1 hypothetical protein VT1337_00605 [Vibrio tubiashii NCIMB 1337 = ATCC 19106]